MIPLRQLIRYEKDHTGVTRHVNNIVRLHIPKNNFEILYWNLDKSGSAHAEILLKGVFP